MPLFEIIGEITNREIIARGGGIDDLSKLKKRYGGRNWRKCKGELLLSCPMVESEGRSFIGMRRTVSANGA